MKRISLNHIVSILLTLLYCTTFAVSSFTTQTSTLLSFIMCQGTLLVCWILFHKINSVYYLSTVAFCFFALYLGTMLRMYDVIPIYDLILHFSSGILLVFAAHFVYERIVSRYKNANVPLMVILMLCFFTSIACAGLWEIWEYSGDTLFGLTSQGSGIDDTMTDIIAGSIGSLIGTTILWLMLKPKKDG